MRRSRLAISILSAALALAAWGPGCQTAPPLSPSQPAGDNGSGSNNQPGPNPNPPIQPPVGQPTFSFTQPTGAVRVAVGGVLNIAWNAGDPAGLSTVVVALVPPTGPETVLFSGQVPAGVTAGQVAWNVSAAAGANYRLRGSVRRGALTLVQVWATGSITIDPPGGPAPGIEIVSPNANQMVKRGDLATIRWRNDDSANAVVDVTLTKDGRAQTLANARPANADDESKAVAWDTTRYPAGQYTVSAKVLSPDGTVIANSTPQPLLLAANQPPAFRWVFPLVPLTINPGTPIRLTWEATDADSTINVLIEAVPISGAGPSTLVATIANPSAVFVRDFADVQTSQFDNGGTQIGDYLLRATVADGVNAPVEVLAPFPVSIVTRPGAPPPPPPAPLPTLVIDQPSLNRTIGRGLSRFITVRWRATAANCPDMSGRCDSPARLTLYADPQDPFNPSGQPNGDERAIGSLLLSSGETQATFNTSGLAEGNYTVFGVLEDFNNPPVLATAPGKIRIVPTNQDESNQPPIVEVTSPGTIRALTDGQVLRVVFSVTDVDAADRFRVRITLDKDRVSGNDVFISGDPVNSTAIRLTEFILPTASGLPTAIDIPINEDVVPPNSESNALGEQLPYNVRVDVNDGFVNPISGLEEHEVAAYAPGGLVVLKQLTRVETRLADLRQVGRSVNGAVFTGFSLNDRSGRSMVRMPHAPWLPGIRSDRADELLITSERAPVYMIMGGVSGINRSGVLEVGRYAGLYSLSSVAVFAPFGVPGIRFGGIGEITSVTPAFLNRANAGNTTRSLSLIFGAPTTAGLLDYTDDDPLDICDCNSIDPPPAPPLPVYNLTRYVSEPALAGAGTNDCPLFTEFGDGLPNSRSDAQNGQEFDGVGAVCVLGTNEDELFGFAANPRRIADNPMNGVEGDPDYITATQGYVLSVEANRFFDNNNIVDGLVELEPIGGRAPDAPENALGTRIRGAWFSLVNTFYPLPALAQQYFFAADFVRVGAFTLIEQRNDFGRRVAMQVDGQGFPLLISAPKGRGFTPMAMDRGEVWVFGSEDYALSADLDVRSLPQYLQAPSQSRSQRVLDRININRVASGIVVYLGDSPGDELGNAGPAGDVNQDGNPDIICGAPGATRGGRANCGVFYGIFDDSPGIGTGTSPQPLPSSIVGTSTQTPGFAILGSTAGDRVGTAHDRAGDFNGDTVDDVILGAPLATTRGRDGMGAPTQTGLAAVVYGAPTLTGVFLTDQLGVLQANGTSTIPSIKFIGRAAGDQLGAAVALGRDFNGDGLPELLINAPGQVWPAANITFIATPADGDAVVVSAAGVTRTYEFDNNSVVNPGAIPVNIAGVSATITVERNLRQAMETETELVRKFVISGRELNVSAQRFSTNILALDPTAAFNVTLSGAGVATRLEVDLTVARRGVSYMIYGSSLLPIAATYVLPDDVLVTRPGGPLLNARIFIGASPSNPVESVAGIGDFDGDGFADIARGAPDAPARFVDEPGQQVPSAGRVYVLYGERGN